MKKAVIIALVFIYAFSVTGVAVKASYCCDKLQSVKLILSDYSKDKEGCCKTKSQSFKIKDVHAASDVISTPSLHFSFIHTLYSCFYAYKLIEAKDDLFISVHAPPLYSKTPAFISNCVFRI